MKLTTKGRYGLKAATELARNYGDAPVSVRSLAQRQGISEQYLEQIFKLLRKGDLVQSIRGAQGGYVLSRAPEEIMVGEIIRALEGSMAPVECVLEGNTCKNAQGCAENMLYRKINEAIDGVIDSVSLQQMIQWGTH